MSEADWLDLLFSDGNPETGLYRNLLGSLLIIAADDGTVLEGILDRLLARPSPHHLPVLLYKLEVDGRPRVSLRLMKSLPRLAASKNCLPPLLSTLRLLGQNSHNGLLWSQCLLTMCAVWRQQDRCMPNLLHLLDAPPQNATGLETLLPQAMVIKEVVLHNPAKYGQDLIPRISLILNANCPAAPTILALQSLYHLVEANILDLESIWKVLQPRLDDHSVTKELFHLLTLVPNQFSPEKHFYQQSLQFLWSQVKSSSPAIASLAYSTLSSFWPESFLVDHLPAVARKSLPPDPEETPADKAWIPGYCFFDLLESVEDGQVLAGYGQLLSSLLYHEIKDLPQGSQYRAEYVNRSSKAWIGDLPNFFSSFYLKSHSAPQSPSLALASLLTFEPNVQHDPSGEPFMPSVQENIRSANRLLECVFRELTISSLQWQSVLLLEAGWTRFMQRLFHLHLLSQGKEGTCLKVKDEILEVLAAIPKQTSSHLCNAMLSLSGLVLAFSKSMSQHHLEEEQEFQLFLNDILDMYFFLLNLSHSKPPGYLTWLVNSAKPSTLVTAVTPLAASMLVPVSTSAPERMFSLVELLHDTLAQEEGSPPEVDFYSGLSAGVTLHHLVPDHYAFFKEVFHKATLRQQQLYQAKSSVDCRVGLALGLCMVGLALAKVGDELVPGIFDFLNKTLWEEQPGSKTYEAISAGLAMVLDAGVKAKVIPYHKVKSTFDLFSSGEPQLDSMFCLGILAPVMDRFYPQTIGNHRLQVFSRMETVTRDANAPFDLIKASLRGCAALFSACLGLTKQELHDNKLLDLPKFIKHLCGLIRNTGTELEVRSTACELASQLYVIHSNQSAAAPTFNDLFFFPEKSILKPAIGLIRKNADHPVSPPHLKTCLRALSQQFPKPLPPLSWDDLFGSMKGLWQDQELLELCVRILFRQGESSQNARGLLLNWITQAPVKEFPPQVVRFLLSNLKQLLNLAPFHRHRALLEKLMKPALQNKGEFAQLALSQLNEVLSQFQDGHPVLKAMAQFVLEKTDEWIEQPQLAKDLVACANQLPVQDWPELPLRSQVKLHIHLINHRNHSFMGLLQLLKDAALQPSKVQNEICASILRDLNPPSQQSDLVYCLLDLANVSTDPETKCAGFLLEVWCALALSSVRQSLGPIILNRFSSLVTLLPAALPLLCGQPSWQKKTIKVIKFLLCQQANAKSNRRRIQLNYCLQSLRAHPEFNNDCVMAALARHPSIN